MTLYITARIRGVDRVLSQGSVPEVKQWFLNHRCFYRTRKAYSGIRLYRSTPAGAPVLYSTAVEFIVKHKLFSL